MAKSKSKTQKSSKAKSKASKPKPKAKAVVKAKARTKSKPKAQAQKKSPAKKPLKLAVTNKVAAKSKSPNAPRSQAAPKLRLVSSAMNFAPLDDRILVQVEGRAERTPGGLFIPDTVAERPNLGRVVAVGPGKRSKKGRLQPLDVRVGDEVMFAQWGGLEIEMPGQSGRFLILRESDLLGVKA